MLNFILGAEGLGPVGTGTLTSVKFIVAFLAKYFAIGRFFLYFFL
jgi:hypothetical protein